MNNPSLVLAEDADAEALLTIQKRAFALLYEQYKDENSPFLDTVDKIKQRISYNGEDLKYFKIYCGRTLCGGIFLYKREELSVAKNAVYKLSSLYIDPEFQGKGIATEAIRQAEAHFPQAKEWILDFPIDKVANRRCYEKSSYMDLGLRLTLNEKLTLAFYHKYIPTLKLVFPSSEHKELWLDITQEFANAKESIIPYSLDLRLPHDDYKSYLAKTVEFCDKEHVSPNFRKTTTYFLMTEKEDRILGAINLRNDINMDTMNTNGNIGYGIRPSERGKGLATKTLFLGLAKCRLEMTSDKVLITCDKTNEPSAKTILRNGGVLENEVLDTTHGKLTQRWWVSLRNDALNEKYF